MSSIPWKDVAFARSLAKLRPASMFCFPNRITCPWTTFSRAYLVLGHRVQPQIRRLRHRIYELSICSTCLFDVGRGKPAQVLWELKRVTIHGATPCVIREQLVSCDGTPKLASHELSEEPANPGTAAGLPGHAEDHSLVALQSHLKLRPTRAIPRVFFASAEHGLLITSAGRSCGPWAL